MSHELLICLVAVAANLAGMLAPGGVMIDTASRSSRRMSSIGSVYASAIFASAAAFSALSRLRLQMAATSHPSERKAGTWTCPPKPTPMMPTLRVDEDTNGSRWTKPRSIPPRVPSRLPPSGCRRRGKPKRSQARGPCACSAAHNREPRRHRRSPVRPMSRRGRRN